MAATGPLMESQEADVFELIEADGRFSTSEFDWDRPPEFKGGSGPYAAKGFPTKVMNSQTLLHQPSEYKFEFKLIDAHGRRRSSKTHSIQFWPGEDTPSEKISDLPWQDVLVCVSHWLDFVHREHTTVNPWEQVQSAAPEGLLPSGAREIPEGEPFSPEEQEAVRQRLDELEQEFRSFRDLTDEQFEALRSEIDALRDELDRMDKWRWARFAVGTSFSLIDLLGLDPAQVAGSVRDLLEFVASLPDQLPPGVP